MISVVVFVACFTYIKGSDVLNYQEQYVDGDKHTNTIEGFWSLLNMDNTTIIKQHTHRFTWLNGVMSTITRILKLSSTSF